MTNPEVFVIVMILLGLAAGSFINVIVFRLPRMMEAAWRAECREMLNEAPCGETRPFNLVRPRSSCPACGHRISALESIPVASYLMLGGRCSGCAWRIPIRYPIIEVCGALISSAAALRFGLGAEAAGACLLGWGLLAASVIDLDTRLLPDSITLPLLWLGIGFNLFDTYAPLRDCVIGAMAGYLLLWSIHHAFKLLTGREGLGYGDFKMLALLGAWLGWEALPGVLLLASATGAVSGIILVMRGRASRDTPVAFGPYLAAAGLAEIYCGDALAEALPGFMGIGT